MIADGRGAWRKQMNEPQVTPRATVGLIGVGLLGSALAERLWEHHVPVLGFDVESARRQALEASGGQASTSAADVFATCDLVLLSLPTSEIAQEVVTQNVAGMIPGATVIDTTTGNPEEMLAIGERLEQRGVNYIEATVAGSSEQLRRGHATLLVGGADARLASVQWLLRILGEKYFHLGPVGSASRFKLVHNLLLGLHRAVLAEGLTFAESLGFDPDVTLEILQQTPAVSGVMATKGRKMVAADYALQARLSQHLKDVRLILSEAERTGASTPLSEVHQALLQQAEQLGLGEVDNSAVIEVYRRQLTDGAT
ncbi:MAG TPA: NAD(P)-dependent oxidoreductase [Planctomycetaceae bacterium]|nr:6-phosphogluconate dehydrogenase [Blastopirellula sp.]HAY79805.1 NAD(P)-dependent oxidoreductase [Planctomycetaceae bacterium]